MKRIEYKETADCNCLILDEVEKLWKGKDKPDFLMETSMSDGISTIHIPDKDVNFSEGDVLVFTEDDVYVGQN